MPIRSVASRGARATPAATCRGERPHGEPRMADRERHVGAERGPARLGRRRRLAPRQRALGGRQRVERDLRVGGREREAAARRRARRSAGRAAGRAGRSSFAVGLVERQAGQVDAAGADVVGDALRALRRRRSRRAGRGARGGRRRRAGRCGEDGARGSRIGGSRCSRRKFRFRRSIGPASPSRPARGPFLGHDAQRRPVGALGRARRVGEELVDPGPRRASRRCGR